MAEKFIKEVNGQLTEQAATQTGGAGNENKIPALNASGQFDLTMMPTGIAPDAASIVTSENLTAGDFVNVWDDAGTPKVRKALAEDGKTADGFVLANYTAPAPALVYFEGRNTQAIKEGGGSLTGGVVYYLSDSSAGTITATAPTASGKHVQRIGKAYSATAISTEGLAYGTIKKA